MKTMNQLADDLERAPELTLELLTSFETNNTEVRSFLFSMQDIPHYIVPHLVRVFAGKYRGDDPKTLAQLVARSWAIGTVFTLQDYDKYNYGFTYVGLNSSGKALCRADNSNMVFEMDIDTEIFNVF